MKNAFSRASRSPYSKAKIRRRGANRSVFEPAIGPLIRFAEPLPPPESFTLEQLKKAILATRRFQP
jgi:hypothetical protein